MIEAILLYLFCFTLHSRKLGMKEHYAVSYRRRFMSLRYLEKRLVHSSVRVMSSRSRVRIFFFVCEFLRQILE